MTARVPGGLYWALGALTMLLVGLWLMPMGDGERANPVPPAAAQGGVVVVTVVVVFPTDTPTPSPTATRTPARTATSWPTKPTCVTPIPETGCRNRKLPTAVPTLTPKPTEPWCEDLLLRKDQDCRWKPASTQTPTATPALAPTSMALPTPAFWSCVVFEDISYCGPYDAEAQAMLREYLWIVGRWSAPPWVLMPTATPTPTR